MREQVGNTSLAPELGVAHGVATNPIITVQTRECQLGLPHILVFFGSRPHCLVDLRWLTTPGRRQLLRRG